MDENDKEMIYVPDYIKERTELAHTYAEDGAYNRAAEILEEIAKYVRNHADQLNVTLPRP